ncbi:MAG TPA: UvrD-helicase domain-containing protein, partial [Flavobacteriaceae bacterium]|nr:UvrD-helicase domain-containing protein [Flavobacteriaceae bacterium]
MENRSTFKVYNASAGSGKTFSLVKEYLKIVLRTNDASQFQHILAITFTNKAANEMKERIVKNLRQFADDTILMNPTDMFLKIVEEINIDAPLIHQRSKSVLQQILTKYGLFSVSTIDS